MKKVEHTYENLVFEGGGVLGAVYSGCIQVLAERNLYDNVKCVAGTSAGAITAGLLAVGAGSDGLTASILTTNFEEFLSDSGWIFGDIYRFFCHYGLHTGDGFVEVLRNYIAKYTQMPDLTFAQLETLAYQEPHKYKHLSVIASNITIQQPVVFDSKNTPNLPIWKAIRCSMSIPFIFEPFEIDGDYFMDGGLSWIYPIDLFDEKKADGEIILNPKTLGFYLESPNDIKKPGFKPSKLKINSLETAITAMYDYLSYNANAKHIHNRDKNRTIFIDNLGIRITQFNISLEDKKRLIEQGKIATNLFLDSQKV